MTSPYRQLRRQGSERARTDRRLRANDSYPDNHFTTFADSSGPGQRDTGSARRYRTYHSRPRRDSAVTGIRVRPHSARRCVRPNETRYSPVGTNLLSESQRQPQSRTRRDFERLGISIRRARVADAHPGRPPARRNEHLGCAGLSIFSKARSPLFWDSKPALCSTLGRRP